MNNRIVGAAALACALSAGALWAGRGPAPAQAQAPTSAGAASALGLGSNIGKVCELRYQSGSDVLPSDAGTLKSVDDNWVVLDVLDMQVPRKVINDNGHKYLQTVYFKTKRQFWVATRSVTTVAFDGDAIVR